MSATFRRALAGLAAGALLAGTGAAQDEPQRGGTLVQAIQGTPRHLNPAVQSGIATGEPGTQLFATPLRFDEDWTPQPYLAESWEVSEDGLTVTLRLVEDAVFHDGEPITSEDVAFSIQTVKEGHPFKAMFAPVEAVETPDEHTAVIRLGQPHPALLLAMSSQLLPIIPKHVYGDQDVMTHPRNSQDVVGSGPFKLVEFVPDQHIVLERNEDFFIDDRPYLDRIVMRVIKDPSARAIALETGETQLSGFESIARDIKRMQANESLEVVPEGYGAVGPLAWLAFNTEREPLSDPKVRQAIAYAVDKSFLLNAILLGTAQEARTGIHPDSPFYEPEVEAYELDIDKANRILDEAGYAPGADGNRFQLGVLYVSEGQKPMAEYLKPQLKKIGIDVEVQSTPDFPTWAQRMATHDFDMSWDIVFNWGDPVIGVHRTYLCDNIKEQVWSNTQSYCNERVDELLAQAAVEQDPEKRKALYSEFQKIVAEDLPLYPVYAVPYHTVSNRKVGNPPRGIWATVQPLDRVYLKP